MEAIRAGHRQEAAALGAPSSPPLSRGLQGAWREWARLGSSEGSGPVTRPLAAPSLLRPGFPGRLRGARGPGRRGAGVAPPGPAHPPGAGYPAGRDEGRGPDASGEPRNPPGGWGRVSLWSGCGVRPRGHKFSRAPPRAWARPPAPASGSRVPAPLEDRASDPARKSRGRPRSAEEASPEAAQAGAGARGRPDLSRPAPSPGMRAGAARSPSALPLLAALRPGVGAVRRTPASPLARRGAGRRGTLIPRPASARTSPGGPRAGNRDTPEGQRT